MGECIDIHIVTAGYLRRFADSRGLIQPVKRYEVPQRPVRPRRPETVGYRPHFFKDRQIARATERRLSLWENRGLQALRRIESTWPVEDDAHYQDRLDIACLIAIHMVRNPAFRFRTAEWKNQNIAQAMQEHDLEEDAARKVLEHVTSEAFSVDHMLGMVPKLASLIASAHWALIEFPAPLLATSDQPVTLVPILPKGMQAPVQPQPAGGYLFCEEFRFPIDPHRVLLFTWANQPDAPEPLAGTDDMAANLNRGVIGGADREWFHNPVRRPTCLPLSGARTDRCFPIARLLLPGYGPVAALESRRRLDAAECLNTMIEDQVTDRFHVARIAVAA